MHIVAIWQFSSCFRVFSSARVANGNRYVVLKTFGGMCCGCVEEHQGKWISKDD